MNAKPQSSSRDDDFFLPDFCGLRMVFAVVVLAELFAIILALAGSEPARLLDQLALISLYMQWAALTCAAVLCLARPFLVRLTDKTAGAVSYLLLLSVIALLSEGAHWLLNRPGLLVEQLSHSHFILRNVGVGAIVAGLALRYFYVQQQWSRRVKAESEARVQALQARIRPHFLFNSMNTIANLTRSQPELAEEMVEDLSDLFRASLGDGRHLVPLSEELLLARRYVHIEGLRLGKRLTIEWQVEAPEDALLPPLTLQPLVENAVYHGIEPLPEGGVVKVSAHFDGRILEFEVGNPLAPADRRRGSGNRLALDNVRERLAAFYPDSRMEVVEESGQFRVRLQVPYLKEEP